MLLRSESVDEDSVAIVVGDEELRVSVVVDIVDAERANSATNVDDSLNAVLEGGLVLHVVRALGTITSDKNAGRDLASISSSGIEGVREARGGLVEAGLGDRELSGEGGAEKVVVPDVSRHAVGEDAVLGFIAKMVAGDNLNLAIVVQVGGENALHSTDSIVNDTALEHGSGGGINLSEGKLSIEELGSNDLNGGAVAIELDSLNNDVGSSGHNMLRPRERGGVSGLLKPEELATGGTEDGLVRTSSEQIETTVTVHINPLAHVVEPATLLHSNGLGSAHWLTVLEANQVKVAIVLPRDEETISKNQGEIAREQTSWSSVEGVGPNHFVCHGAVGDRSVQVLDGLVEVINLVNFAACKRIASETGDNKRQALRSLLESHEARVRDAEVAKKAVIISSMSCDSEGQHGQDAERTHSRQAFGR